MAGLKVRLDDGSEVGPMDLEMVQTWFQQGLIAAETQVQKPGSPRWVPLAEAVDLRSWQASRSAPRARGMERGGATVGFESERGVGGRWRLYLASVLFLALAIAAGLAAIFPDRLRPELDGAPWPQIGLGLAALGLLLVRGWNAGRWIARVVAMCAAAAAFPLAGIFVARGMRGEALLVLGSCALLAAGFVAFLGRRLSLLGSAAALLPIVAGGAGLVRFAPAEPSAVSAVQMQAWAAPERRIADPEVGLELTLPAGWIALKAGNPLLTPPANARAVFAQPRLSGYAFLLVEPPPAAVLSLEHYLDDVMATRRGGATAYEETGRKDGRLGGLASRRASGHRVGADGRWVERIAVAQDGDRYVALVAWVPEGGGGRAIEEIDALEAAVALPGVRGASRRAVVDKARLELPQLSSGAVDRLLPPSGSATPAELFRRAAAAAARGRASLGAAESQELDTLTASALATLGTRERASLAEYLRRASAAEPGPGDEDERMRLLMKTAALRLGAAQRFRIGELLERAIRAGIEGRPPAS